MFWTHKHEDVSKNARGVEGDDRALAPKINGNGGRNKETKEDRELPIMSKFGRRVATRRQAEILAYLR